METNPTTTLRLTELSHGSGCGCKIAPAVLEKIIRATNHQAFFTGLIVGNDTNDDAAVIELPGTSQYLISTVDFFTPVVDDPYQFGRIAAANALSDVYAMGGTPLLATAVLGFPVEKLPSEIAAAIIDGGRAVCNEAGIPLAGGHSIDAPELFFGLSVNGLVSKDNLKRNSTAKPGDLLFLTKPIGSGIISAAVKRGKADGAHADAAVRIMSTVNRIGEKLGNLKGVHAMTDVTGFGLLGHLIEMASGSGCSAQIYFSEVPLIDGIKTYMDQFIFPDNTYRNWNAYENKVKGINGPEFIPLCDPQTNGGLLVAVDPDDVKEFIAVMESENITVGKKPIGQIIARQEQVVEIFIK